MASGFLDWLIRSSAVVVAMALLAGCGGEPAAGGSTTEPTGSTAEAGAAPDADPLPASFTVLCLGDSLTAGYGLPDYQAWPAVLEARLRDDGYPVRVINAGTSGDTSAGGLSRVDWVLRAEPDLAIVTLGGNDGLRGQPTEALEANLSAIVSRFQDAGVPVVLLGYRMPTSHGEAYRTAFDAVYPAVAQRHDVPLLPFVLEGVATDPDLLLSDRLHPNADGHAVLAANIDAFLREVAVLPASRSAATAVVQP